MRKKIANTRFLSNNSLEKIKFKKFELSNELEAKNKLINFIEVRLEDNTYISAFEIYNKFNDLLTSEAKTIKRKIKNFEKNELDKKSFIKKIQVRLSKKIKLFNEINKEISNSCTNISN